MHTPPLQTPNKQPKEINPYEIEKGILMQAMCQWELGINFLRWLCRICKWESSMMSTEDAAIRDIWLHMRQYVPVEALAKIESEAIKAQQELYRTLFELTPEGKEDDNGTEG